jgi:hypothetical protein
MTGMNSFTKEKIKVFDGDYVFIAECQNHYKGGFIYEYPNNFIFGGSSTKKTEQIIWLGTIETTEEISFQNTEIHNFFSETEINYESIFGKSLLIGSNSYKPITEKHTEKLYQSNEIIETIES